MARKALSRSRAIKLVMQVMNSARKALTIREITYRVHDLLGLPRDWNPDRTKARVMSAVRSLIARNQLIWV